MKTLQATGLCRVRVGVIEDIWGYSPLIGDMAWEIFYISMRCATKKQENVISGSGRDE